MKKALVVLLVFSTALLAACSGKQENIIITKNMLVYENDKSGFQSVRGEFEAVTSVIRTEVTLLEESYNEKLTYENPDTYFLDDEYILSTFAPFTVDGFELTESFTEAMDSSSAAAVFEDYANGADVSFENDGSVMKLKFTGNESMEVYSVSCSSDCSSFIYEHDSVTSGGEECVDFLEFVKVSDNTYAIQSSVNRCYVSFDSQGHIEYFRISSLESGLNTPQESVYYALSSPGKNWVTKNKNASYNCIIEFKDGILYLKDSSTGNLKETQIKEEDYYSVFIY